MNPTPVPAFEAPPDFPVMADRAAGTWNGKAIAWAFALQSTTGPNVYAMSHTAYLNAIVAKESADIAAAQAGAALASVNAPKWVSGTNYAADVCAWSPSDKQTYRRNAPGGISTVDPSLDSSGPTAGWTRISGGDPVPQYLISNTGVI